MNPRVLVGIATRNRAGILPKAVASALAQTAPHMQVAVLDDGSTDGTPELAARFPQVIWIRRTASQGIMSARNELMARPGFDFYVSLDDDAWFLREDEIPMALQLMAQRPRVAAVAFDILAPDQPTVRERAGAQPASVFIGCGHVLRLAAVRAVGAYEPTPGGYGGEEKDLCLRLMDAGHEIVRLPGVHVWHDKTPLARDIPHQHRSGVCNDLVMTLRRTPLLALPLALPVKVCRHLRFSWRAGLMQPCLAGVWLFTRSLPAVCRSRRPVRLETLRVFMQLSRSGTAS